ncbi:MAG TPA: MFS transporter, partial [Anaerolineales bacterium]
MRFLPILFLSPFGGVVADTYNRRRILFITQATMIVSAAMLGILTWLGVIQIWHIYLLTGLQAVAISFDLPARQSLIPNLVPRELLPSAFGLNSIAQNTGAIVGPALSGVVIASLGQQWTYLFNAFSFGAVVLALVLMGPVEQMVKAARMTVKSSLLSIREGVHFITHQPIILS